MTRHKATKAAIRARMAKTGERYTTARHHALKLPQPTSDSEARPRLASSPSDATDAPLPPDVPDAPDPDAAASPSPISAPIVDVAVADRFVADAAADSPADAPPPAWIEHPGLSDDAIWRGTGAGWATWFARLDAWGAATKSHAAIARYLGETHGVDGWWAQSLTVGYERARGLRRRHEHANGFAITASKTIAAPASAVFAALVDPAQRDRWLPAGLLTERTSQPDRSARFDVSDPGSRLAAWLVSKGDAKTALQLEEERLAPAMDLAARKAFWRERLATLATLLTAGDA